MSCLLYVHENIMFKRFYFFIFERERKSERREGQQIIQREKFGYGYGWNKMRDNR